MALVLDGEIKSATDLQKRTKDVLDAASDHPVVIRREQKDDIALVSHALARRVFAVYDLASILEGAWSYVLGRLRSGKGEDAKGYPLELEWLREFDDDDVVDFANELTDAYRRVLSGDRPASDVTDVVEQWRRSALVSRDDALRERLERERAIILEGGAPGAR